jgi:hypothetical protein
MKTITAMNAPSGTHHQTIGKTTKSGVANGLNVLFVNELKDIY